MNIELTKLAVGEGVAGETGRTGAVVGAWLVVADGVGAAHAGRRHRSVRALVDVDALAERAVAPVAAHADAHVGTDTVVADALLVGWAGLVGAAGALLGLDAALAVRVTVCTAGALADEAAPAVTADGSRRARRAGALVDVGTTGQSATGEAGCAHALGQAVDEHALCVRAAGDVLAGICGRRPWGKVKEAAVTRN